MAFAIAVEGHLAILADLERTPFFEANGTVRALSKMVYPGVAP